MQARLWFTGAAFAFAADRALKHLALGGITSGSGLLRFALFKNTGIAFSIPVANVLFWPAAIACFAVLLVLFARELRGNMLRAAMLCTVLLGAVSNLADRWMYGWTTDYLIFFNIGAWNIADFMIIGGLLALYAASPRPRGSAVH